MSDKRKRQLMENLDKCYKIVQQSSKTGISAIDLAERLKIHRTTAHSYLNTLELMGKVYSQHGLWYPKEPIQKDHAERKESKSSFKYMQKLYEKIIELRLNPQQRYREDGSIYYYHNTFEIIPTIKILINMHPLLKEQIVEAVKNSKLNPFGSSISPRELNKLIENFALTSEEMDQLIGKIGKALDQIGGGEKQNE